MKIEIRKYTDEETYKQYRALFVDDTLFDWGLDEADLQEACRLSESNPIIQKSVQGNIQQHFLESFSEFIGREITLQEVNVAIETGKI